MNTKITAYLDSVIYLLLIAVVALIPLVFAPLTTEYFETPKLILLVVVVIVGLVLWALKWLSQGKVVITKTPLDLGLLLLLAVVIISTVLSDSRYTAILGNSPRIHGSLVTWAAYILFYFLLTSSLRHLTQARLIVVVLVLSTTVAALLTLAAYFGLYLPIPFAQTASFSPAGSSFSMTALTILLLPVLLLSLINRESLLPPLVTLIITTILAATLVLVGTSASLIVAALLIGIIVSISKRSALIRALPTIFIPMAVALALLLVSFLPAPNNLNIFHSKRVNFPQEIQLPFVTSWKVSASSFRDAPFVGTGPSTYLYNFTAYKSIEHNNSRFWNIRFDTAFNEYLQIFGTLGLLGLAAFLLLTLVIVKFAWRGLAAEPLTQALSVTAIGAVLLMLIHPLTPVMAIAMLTLLATLMSVDKSISGKVEELVVGIKASRLADTTLMGKDVLPIILVIPILIIGAVILFNTAKVVQADYFHRQALNATRDRGLDTYNNLIAAERFNPYLDLYRTDLAQTNFALANAIALAKRPTEASPTGSLTDQDRQNIRQLLSQAINESRVATALSPRSASNWEVLGSIYRQISGVAQNALAFALDAYGRAIQRDPLNPNLRLIVGGVYYSVRNYDLAIRFFTDSVNLKPDFANGYYNLSIALRDKGDLQGAQATAERTVALLDPASPDYQTASNYLSDLKARIATGSARQAPGVPPAAQESGALQNRQLPNVLELPQPEQIATPPAVRRNPRAVQPSPTPSPSPTP